MDLRDFLPLDGEDRIEMLFADGSLRLNIFFETADPTPRAEKRCLLFGHAKYFVNGPFPGLSLFTSSGEKKPELLSALVEYEHSELREMESARSGDPTLKHYRVFLFSTHIAIHVIARSFEMLTDGFSQ